MKAGQHQTESLSKNFSDFLKARRGTASQAEFARLIGVSSQATYQRYEAGRIPDGDILYQIATHLGVTVEEILTGKKAAEPTVYEIRPQSSVMNEAAESFAPARQACENYLRAFLDNCQNDPAKFGWTLIELKEKFPLNKWDKK